MNKNNKKGFTLAELLIVVAIIGVLVAVSIPIFTAQLEKARDATSVANMRSAYAEASAALLTEVDDPANQVTIVKDSGGKITSVTVGGVKIQTAQSNSWSGSAASLPFDAPEDTGNINGTKTITFTVTDGQISEAALS